MSRILILTLNLFILSSLNLFADTISTKGLVVDLDANLGVETNADKKVIKWMNQVPSSKIKNFVIQNKGRKVKNSGAPSLLQKVKKLNNNSSMVFKRQELVNHEEDALDHLTTGNGYTWVSVMSFYKQIKQLKDVNSFFGNLKNGGLYEGFWGGVTDENHLWIGSRNGITIGRWDHNNPMVLTKTKLKEKQYYIIAGRMASGQGKVPVESFINNTKVSAKKLFPVNPKGNASKLTIGQERDAINHPGFESFDGEIARFLIYERPLNDGELDKTIKYLRKKYSIIE